METAMKLVLTLLVLSTAAWAAGCESVKDLKLPNTTITRAETVAPGAFQPAQGRGGKGPNPYQNLPAFCRVAATLTPSSDSDIKIEVWMPTGANWNASLQSVGNGAWAGSISYAAMATALAGGYATASTDTGHTGGSAANFIPGHPEKVIDFAYRAVHETTVAAKAIITANYGRAASRAYWNGCSTGGRQALAEAQRYPGDYDGIIAGAPANYVTHLQGAQVWTATIANRSEATKIPQAKFAAIHTAALAACDANDGVTDGVIENPRQCNFDPAVLACKGADAADCLTAAQVETARMTYAGPKTARGSSLFPGLEPGSETGWNTLSGNSAMGLADDVYKYLVYKDAAWDFHTFDAERDMALADRTISETMDSIDPNLKPFFDRGGKLLIYHGWADPGIAPRNSVNYYQSVVDTLGQAATSSSIRLFMLPGVGHCRGGDGPDTFDAMGVINQWVNGGAAPQTIEAARVRQGQTDRTRPLCAFPQVARYSGSGSTDESANFSCVAP
jgi:feruloyl esterase